jgi:cytochrome P450
VPTDLLDFSLFATEQADAVFDRLRRESPVYWHSAEEGSGFWVVSRYADTVEVLRRPDVFSSEHGNMLRLRGTKDPAAGLMMVVTDPPRHTRLRKLLTRAFTARVTEANRPRVRAVVAELLERVEPGAQMDFTRAVAERLPVAVACAVMGVPREDWPLMAELTHASSGAEDPEFWKGESIADTLMTANTELLAYFSDLIPGRRTKPGQDLISLLVHAEVDGEHLDDAEVAVNCFSLMLGGNEATRYAAAGGLMAFIQHPGQFDLLAREPSGMALAVEEVLRWTSPTVHIMRVATRDTAIAGVPVRAGDLIAVWPGSANRDETVFEDPYRFSITRTPNRHVTFGAGCHYCIGASMARLELAALYDCLLASGLRAELAGRPVRLRSNFLRGYKHLPVRFAAR